MAQELVGCLLKFQRFLSNYLGMLSNRHQHLNRNTDRLLPIDVHVLRITEWLPYRLRLLDLCNGNKIHGLAHQRILDAEYLLVYLIRLKRPKLVYQI